MDELTILGIFAVIIINIIFISYAISQEMKKREANEAIVRLAEASTKSCPHCHKGLNSNAQFCHHCGIKL
jgi:zinc-ribbon domain